MMGVGAGAAAAIGAGVSAAGGIASSAISSSAAGKASSQQTAAAQAALSQQINQQQVTSNNLYPFVSLGTQAEEQLTNLSGLNAGGNPLESALFTPYQAWDPTEAGLESTPGYQFTKEQGLESTQNSFASQGLASSGAALKGAASYATGLADSTYNQQYQNYLAGKSSYLAQNQQTFNDLSSIGSLGENAAAGLGSLGQQNSNSQSQLTTGAGAAQAAGTVGSANATSSGITNALGSLGSGLSTQGLLSTLQGSGLLGGNNAGLPAASGSTNVGLIQDVGTPSV